MNVNSRDSVPKTKMSKEDQRSPQEFFGVGGIEVHPEYAEHNYAETLSQYKCCGERFSLRLEKV